MTVNDSESFSPAVPRNGFGAGLFRAWLLLRRQLKRPKCALCRQALEQEDHGWYSVWRCRQKHFTESILH